ncbi:Oidioi.mRNA.OKI2018_I69.PAR.g9402.t1.cds [Oikopleura dioica]|uniref:Oidioi.mRNA.OKI2018_I69.PAR.g9402.t1.cds n=1 Tax=Oikopleura dioica TaxID=34765 RepID=A0ABN7RKB2_OIKDI|nr:Oidioi.mRNA.OKI2018_I69.PAR.g9402.t1.cds [Oikopleura dioica]
MVDTHEILFAPKTSRNLEIINRTCADIREKFNGYDFFGKVSASKKFVPKGFSQVEDMEEYIARSRNTRNIYLGVHFHDVSEQLNFTIRTLPTAGKYPIKGNWEGWMGHLSSPTIFGKMITNTIGSTLIDDHSQWSLYYTEGFLAVQNSIQKQFLEQNGVYHDADQILQPSGQSAKLTTTFPEMAQQQLHLIFMLGFAHFIQHVLKTITRHRVEHRLDYLSLVGASPKDIILAHHFVSLVLQSIASAVLSYALTANISTNGAIFPHTSFSVIWLLLTAYGSSLIFLCHLASTFFTKPTTAATIISAIIFFISVPHGFISTSWRLMPFLPKIAIILNPTIMLALGCDIICHYQSKNMGLSLTENFYEKISFEDPLGMFDVIVYLLVTTVFYFLLTLSFEKIKSRKLQGQKKTEASRFEVKDLSKFYESSNQVALDKVSFKTEENEITALLGANGAGKSTLLNILCGFMEPTSGSDLVGGGNCGYCPQHNIFFEYLSVREHFEIFSKLSTTSLEKAKIESLAKDVQLFDKLENYPNQLSGGMLRKLTLGLSIIGRPKRLLLDEPTSGLDPVSRNELWGILRNLSASTSILMSTHYMDEAENLASSVLFLKEGKLCESGSLEEVMSDRPTGLSSLFELESEEKHMKERKDNHRVLENAIQKSRRNISSMLLYQLRKCFILLKRDPFILFMQFFLPTAVVILTDISLDSNRNASPEASTVNYDDVLKIVGTGISGIVHLPDYDFTMYPNDFFHAPPAALLHSHRTVLRAKTNASIFLTHKPFDLPQPEGSVLFTDSFVKGMTVVYNCILAMMMMMSPVGMNVVEERKTGFRQIQAHTSALKRRFFWLVQYATCLLQSVALLAGCMMVTSLFIKSPNFQFGIGEVLPIFSVCLRFFIAHMPVAFIVGHFSEDKGSFVGHHSNVNFICTILMFMSATCTQIFTGNEQSSVFFQLYGILPSYNFAIELFEIYCEKTFSKFCVSKSHSGVSFFCQAVEIDPLSGIRITGDPWIRCFVLSSIYWGILYFLENSSDTEFSVIKETDSDPYSKGSIQIKNITKFYKEKSALKNVSFDLNRGETVCLLGSNGAGKTTLLSILCKLNSASSGVILRSGRIGYCRQRDCLLDSLTVEETIEILLGTRGVANCKNITKEIISLVDIEKYSKRLTKQLSGGAKRKLCVAISILNNPDFIVLDEPSCGLDPSARIKMKSLLQVFENLNKGVLVSTHVVEESKLLGTTSIFLERGQVKEIVKH